MTRYVPIPDELGSVPALQALADGNAVAVFIDDETGEALNVPASHWRSRSGREDFEHRGSLRHYDWDDEAISYDPVFDRAGRRWGKFLIAESELIRAAGEGTRSTPKAAPKVTRRTATAGEVRAYLIQIDGDRANGGPRTQRDILSVLEERLPGKTGIRDRMHELKGDFPDLFARSPGPQSKLRGQLRGR